MNHLSSDYMSLLRIVMRVFIVYGAAKDDSLVVLPYWALPDAALARLFR